MLGQGRLTYRVIRKQKEDISVKIRLCKLDESTGGKLNGSKFTVSSGNRVDMYKIDGFWGAPNWDNVTIGTKVITVYPNKDNSKEKYKDSKYKWFKINLQETSAPAGYSINSGQLTLKVYYKDNGDVVDVVKDTEPSSWSGMWSYNHTSNYDTIYLKNKKNGNNGYTNLMLRKTGINNAPLTGAKFEVWIYGLGELYNVRYRGVTLDNRENQDTSNGVCWGYSPTTSITKGGITTTGYMIHVWNLETSCTDHTTNYNAIEFTNLLYSSGWNLCVIVKETDAPPGDEDGGFYYEKANYGNEKFFNFSAMLRGGTSRVIDAGTILDKYGNSDTAMYFAPSDEFIIDYHNEPIYKTNLVIDKYKIVSHNSDGSVNGYSYLKGVKFRVKVSGLAKKEGVIVTDYNDGPGNNAIRERTIPSTAWSGSDSTGYTLTMSDLCSGELDDGADDIKLQNLTWMQGKPIHICVEETGVPNTNDEGYYYEKLQKKIEFDIYPKMITDGMGGAELIPRKKDTYGNWYEASYNSYYEGMKKSVFVQVYNQPFITLSGRVWEDGQTGSKKANVPDGVYKPSTIADEGIGDKGIGGVTVNLIDEDDATLAGYNGVESKAVIGSTSTASSGVNGAGWWYMRHIPFR